MYEKKKEIAIIDSIAVEITFALHNSVTTHLNYCLLTKVSI